MVVPYHKAKCSTTVTVSGVAVYKSHNKNNPRKTVFNLITLETNRRIAREHNH